MGLLQRILQNCRSLFPYWKFFDRLGGVPRLDYRFSDKMVLSDWKPLHPHQKLSLQNIFINEKVNLMHWELSLLMRLFQECQKLNNNELANHEIYLWFKNRVASELSGQKYDWFQFRIQIQSYQNQKMIEDLWIESESFARLQK